MLLLKRVWTLIWTGRFAKPRALALAPAASDAVGALTDTKRSSLYPLRFCCLHCAVGARTLVRICSVMKLGSCRSNR